MDMVSENWLATYNRVSLIDCHVHWSISDSNALNAELVNPDTRGDLIHPLQSSDQSALSGAPNVPGSPPGPVSSPMYTTRPIWWTGIMGSRAKLTGMERI